MTLIARARWNNGWPIYIGDVLLMTSEGRPRAPVMLPAVPNANVRIEPSPLAPRFVSGTVQKLNILYDMLLIAWAGSRYHAEIVLKEFHSLGPQIQPEDICRILEARPDPDPVHLIGTLLIPSNDGTVIFDFQSRQSMEIREGNVVAHADGKGASAIRFYLSTFAAQVERLASQDSLNPDYWAAVDLAALLVGEESLTDGANLEDGYGGAFEAAVATPTGFRKLTDKLHLSFQIRRIASGQYRLKFFPILMRYSYVGRTLLISVFHATEPNKVTLSTHIVDPMIEADAQVRASPPAPYFEHSLALCQIDVEGGLPSGIRSITIRLHGSNLVQLDPQTQSLTIAPRLLVAIRDQLRTSYQVELDMKV